MILDFPQNQNKQSTNRRTKEEDDLAKIMVVDDEKPILDMARKWFNRIGKYEVSTYLDSESALSDLTIDPDQFGFIMLDLKIDIKIRVESGVDLAREIRKLNASVPIILWTGRATPEEVQELKGEDLFEEIFLKPISMKDVLGFIKTRLPVAA